MRVFGAVVDSFTVTQRLERDLREVFRGSFPLVVSHRFGDRRHGVRVAFTGIGALAIAIREFLQLLKEIFHGKSVDRSVFRAALTVRIVAKRAGANVGTPPVRDDVRHGRMIAGEPVGGTEAVIDLLAGEFACAAFKVQGRLVLGGTSAATATGEPTSTAGEAAASATAATPSTTAGSRS